jgi:hypothetical protein
MPNQTSDTMPGALPSFHNRSRLRVEMVAADDRAALRPSEVVTLKLLGLLPSRPIPVSCLHTRRDCRR